MCIYGLVALLFAAPNNINPKRLFGHTRRHLAQSCSRRAEELVISRRVILVAE